jgi:hypothetical protein
MGGGFGYHSMKELNGDGALTASEHLERLSDRYSAPAGYELFRKIMSLQDNGDKCLLSVFRFPYLHAYYTERMDFGNWVDDFVWSIDHAARALKLQHRWFTQSGYEAVFVMIIRRIPDWIKSRSRQMGRKDKRKDDLIIKRLHDIPVILRTCRELGIPVFWMREVIDEIKNNNNLDFENSLRAVDDSEIEQINENMEAYVRLVRDSAPYKPVRLKMLGKYIAEKDPVKRISMVRSIGGRAIKIGKYVPFFNRRIKNDLDNRILDNARIKCIT